MSKLIFITGGARSGKSDLAVRLARESGGRVAFIATARAEDEEMAMRIMIHKQSRPKEWLTIEEYEDLASAIASAKGYDVVIIDCLTLFLSNLIHRIEETTWILDEVTKAATAAKEFNGVVIVISNEIGMGIVPDNRLAREFRDVAGRANQIMAQVADEVYICFSGIPVKIKGSNQ